MRSVSVRIRSNFRCITTCDHSGELPCKIDNRADVLAVSMHHVASIMNLAGPDLIVILLIVLVLFGAKKLPELARGMGQAVKEFQKAKDEFTDELHKSDAPKVPTVQQAQLTVPQNPPSPVTHPDPNLTANPGSQSEQV